MDIRMVWNKHREKRDYIKSLTPAENRKRIFVDMPIWKSVLRMALPGMIQMLVMGGYMFIDSVLAVHFGSNHYHDMPGLDARSQVRMFMSAATPIQAFISAMILLFSVGTATRASINLGRGDFERAKRTLRSGASISMIASFVLIPVLYFAAKPWMAVQYHGSIASFIADGGFDFAWILIIGIPLQSFGQVNAGLFRIEGRSKELLIITTAPMLLNILFDWILMGPGKLGVDGASWGTFMANGIGAFLAVYFIVRGKSDILTLRNMYGKFKLLPLIGIMLVGVAPFLRQLAQSTTQTAEASVIGEVSQVVYSHIAHPDNLTAATTMNSILASSMPVFMFVFPISFAFSQSVRPIAAYNYGAKDYQRVRQAIKWTLIYAFITSLFLYFMATFALGSLLLDALGVGNAAERAKSLIVLKIVMIMMPLFTITIVGMTLFGSTDRVIFSIIASSLRGFILLFPVLFFFRYLAISNPSSEFLFWWFMPVLGASSSFFSLIMIIITYFRLEKHHVSLDARIDKVNARVIYFSHKQSQAIKGFLKKLHK